MQAKVGTRKHSQGKEKNTRPYSSIVLWYLNCRLTNPTLNPLPLRLPTMVLQTSLPLLCYSNPYLQIHHSEVMFSEMPNAVMSNLICSSHAPWAYPFSLPPQPSHRGGGGVKYFELLTSYSSSTSSSSILISSLSLSRTQK